MNNNLLLMMLLLLAGNFCLAQDNQNNERVWDSDNSVHATYKVNNFDEPIIDRDSLYIPVKNGKKVELHIAALKDTKISRIFRPLKPFEECKAFAIENGFIYYHTTEKVTKVNMANKQVLWTAEYTSKWGAQLPPVILDQYITATTDDCMLVLDKESGKQVQLIKSKNLEESPSLSGNNLIYSKFNGTVMCMSLKTSKELWRIDVGESSGFGSLTDGQNIYLPSWSPRFYCLNRQSGKPNWVLNLDDIKNGCGSGFEEVPVLIDDKLYAPHRDEGLFVLDKNTGKLIRNIETASSSEDITGGAGIYNNHIIYASNKNLYIYSIEAETLIHRIKLPTEFRSDIFIEDSYLVIANKGYYKLAPIVVVYDLNKFIGE